MPDTPLPDPCPEEAGDSSSRWHQALHATGIQRDEALRDLAGSYWYCVYAWWRRSGLGEEEAAVATLGSFGRWLGDAPPTPAKFGAARMRECLPALLGELAEEGAELDGTSVMAIDREWAEKRYADEPPGQPDLIFQRRWALTVLELGSYALRDEYAARGEEDLLAELYPFAGFDAAEDERYAAAAQRVGRSSGAMRKAVFDFRSRQREILRCIAADTVIDPADIESELVTLIAAIDAPGAAAGPLPSGIRNLKPDEVLARAMQSVRLSGGADGRWQAPDTADIARLFPQYEILGLQGRGGMGAVYKARQIELDRVVAIKLLPLEVSADVEFAERFRREARAMAKLSHPHIVTVYDFGSTSEGHLFFVMEFIEGCDLQELIRDDGMEPTQALVMCAQVCTALAYAHEKGIIHRDVKPANVMVDLFGQAKVTDFGLARLMDNAADEAGHTVTGTVIGTPDYMAPEQRDGHAVDHRADIYSVGVMLYAMLCRETPQGVFDPPSKRIKCDPRIDKIVLKAMNQSPDRRYQSTQEMRADMAHVLTPVHHPPARGGHSTQPLAPGADPESRKNAGTALAFLALLIVAGGLLYLKYRPKPAAPTEPLAAQATPGGASASAAQPQKPAPSTANIPPPVSATPAPGKPTPAPPKPEVAKTAATPAPAPKISPTGQWLAEQQPLWKTAFENEVTEPFQASVATLKKQYTAAVETHLAAAAKATKLEEALAFRNERDRFASGGDMPAEDEAALLPALKTLRASYRTSFKKLEEDRFTRAKTVHGRYEAILAQNQGALTQKQRLDEALELKNVRETLSATWLVPPAGNGAVDATTSTPPAAGEQRPAVAKLSDPIRGTPAPTALLKDSYTNTLGMRFVKVPGSEVLFCVHETRRRDYATYAANTPGVNGNWQNTLWANVPVGREDNDPVVSVSWDDAQAFCQWLSEREGVNHRLPTDEEWSYAVGLGRKERRLRTDTPETLNQKDKTDLQWDGAFPPRTRERVGNLTDTAYHDKFPADRWMQGYTDGFPTTSLVMSFKPNKLGLYDMAGNVSEWVQDWYNPTQTKRTLRGSNWQSSGPVMYFLASYRNEAAASVRSQNIGFRTVVEERLPPRAQLSQAKPTTPPAPAFVKTETTNSLGMKLTSLPGTDVLFCIHETRYKDYVAFAAENPSTPGYWKNQTIDGFVLTERAPEHPVTSVSWNEAKAFCEWLSQKEGKSYRLPSDQEWSIAAGLASEENWPAGTTPETVSKTSKSYPWGTQWPPPPKAGNFSDESRQLHAWRDGLPDNLTRVGYDDGAPTTAPVMSYTPNQFGIFDLAGNVSEWCQTPYGESAPDRFVIRGSAWNTADESYLHSVRRNHNVATYRSGTIGFRIVLDNRPTAAPQPAAVNPAPAPPTTPADITNSLGMQFRTVPILGGPTAGQRVLFSIWPTRLQDYNAFVSATKRFFPKPAFPQQANHPAVLVTWEDAQAFCDWLTEREHKSGKLPAKQVYRPPTDHEWSCAIGIGDREDPAKLPVEKSKQLANVYPWGTSWPPPAKYANFASDEVKPAMEALGKQYVHPSLAGYIDGFAFTSPVDAFPANRFGLYDMVGNISQWCEDWYEATHTTRAVRGNSWLRSDNETLLSSFRTNGISSARYDFRGFRVVIADIPSAKATVTAKTAPGVPSPEAPTYRNTLTMQFRPVPITGGPTKGQHVLFSIWATRVQDYAVFAKETKIPWERPPFDQGPLHPAVMVSYDDAQSFCEWLTERERKAGKLPENLAYRLPADHEFSCAIGIGELEDPALSPAEKKDKLPGAYPWGEAWPPPPGAGNYAGEELQPAVDAMKYEFAKGVIKNYRDEFEATAPVGSFPANRFGLYDMGGNAWQWCEDRFSPERFSEYPARGACWNNSGGSQMFSSHRLNRPPTTHSSAIGFRCVLAPAEPPPVVPKDANGWEDLLAALTPAALEKAGKGWTLKDGELISSSTRLGTVTFPGKWLGRSYALRIKLHALQLREVFHVIFPVGERMTGFELDGFAGHYTGLNSVAGKAGKDSPDVVEGRQIQDENPHLLELIIRLTGPDAAFAATLDSKPLYQWSGPIEVLGQNKAWGTTKRGALAFGTLTPDWSVSEVKARELRAGE